jgi:PAS domain S-box-containing protein
MKIDSKFRELREKAKELLKNEQSEINHSISHDIDALIEELNIYKIELDLQNQELQKSNHELAVQKQRYQSLYMESPVGYFTLNQTGNIIEMNNEACNMLGIPVHQAKYTSIFPYLTEDSKIKLNRFYKSIQKSDSIDYEDIVFNTKNNERIYTNIKAIACNDSDTNEMTVRFAVTNQTKIKEYEKEIEKQKRANQIMSRYEVLFNTSLSGIAISDTLGNIIECNDSFAKMLKCKKKDLLGSFIGDFSHPDEIDDEINNLKKMDLDNSQIRYEKRYVREDGSIVWADINLSVICNDTQPEFYLGIVNDITDKKKYQQKIAESEVKLNTIVQNIPDIIFHLDKEGRFVDFYQERDDLFVTPDNFMNKTVYEIFDEEFAEKIHNHTKLALSSGSSKLEYSFDIDGQKYYIAKFRKLFENEVIILISDITELKEKEKEIFEKQKKLDMFFNNSKDGYFFMSLDKPVKIDKNSNIDDIIDNVYKSEKVDRVNQAALDIFKAQESDFIGKTPYDFFGDSAERKEIWKQMLLNKQVSLENSQYTMDGKKLIVEGTYIALFDENGYLTGHFGVQRDVTERKLAEQRITKLNRRLEGAMIGGNMAWWEMELPSGKILFNENKAHILGRNPDDFKHYKDFMALVHPDDYEIAMNAMHKVLEGKAEVYECEYRMKRIDNEYIWFYDRGVIKDRTEDKIILTGIVQDINIQKMAELAIKRSEEKYRLIAENASDVITILNLTKEKFTYISPSVYDLRGYTVEESMQQNLSQTFTPDSLKIMQENSKERLLQLYANPEEFSKKIFTREWQLTKKDGSIIWVETTVKHYLNENKEVESLGITRNIDSRKKAELALKRSENFLRTTINAITHPFYVVNVDDYSIALANDDAGGDASIGKKCHQISHNSDEICGGSEHPCPLHKVLETKEEHITEHIHFDKNGNEINVEVHAYPIFDESGEIKQIIEHNIDITEKKKIQRELKEQYELFDKFFHDANEGFFFMMLDEPVEWNDNIDKEKALDYVFTHQRITKMNDTMLAQYKAKKKNSLGLLQKTCLLMISNKGEKYGGNFLMKENLILTQKNSVLTVAN